MYNKVVIGIDQSYHRTGISVAADGELKIIKSIDLSKHNCNSEKRMRLYSELSNCISALLPKTKLIVCIVERIRLRSGGFLNIDYIKSIGALNCMIIDLCYTMKIPVYSVDTRCWKAQVVGTSKPQTNKYGVPDEKWPTVKWVIGLGFENKILMKVEGRRLKGTFMRNEIKYEYDNDASDSAGIAMFGFVGEENKLELER